MDKEGDGESSQSRDSYDGRSQECYEDPAALWSNVQLYPKATNYFRCQQLGRGLLCRNEN